MHESEAMDFIASVLRGTIERMYKLSFNEKIEILPSLNKIRSYLKDSNGYWVKVKAEDIINYFEDVETNFVKNGYKPESIEEYTEIVLYHAKETMQNRIDEFKTEKNKNPKRIHVFFPLPLLLKSQDVL